MKFHLTADATFEADDIDDALILVGQHLIDQGEVGHSFFTFLGDINIEPSED